MFINLGGAAIRH